MNKKPVRLLSALLILVCILFSFFTAGYADQLKPEAFAGKKIGVLTGSIFDSVAKNNIPEADVRYYNSNADTSVALEKGKIDAIITDQPVWRVSNKVYPDHECVYTFSNEEYAFIFQKNNEKASKLCDQLNDFLIKCQQDGTLKEIDEIWFGDDESKKIVDTATLTPENGTLIFSASSEIGIPFCYMKDNGIVGYDIDVAVRFCRAYGYGIEIRDTSFGGMIADVSTGKSDFGGSCITVTEERKESMLFSVADYIGGSVLVTKSSPNENNDVITSIKQLAGKKVAVQTGTVFDKIALEYLPDSNLEYFNSGYDLAIALDSDKISAYLLDEPFARMLISKYRSQRILKVLTQESYALALPKNNPNTPKLIKEFNAFIEKSRKNGTIDELIALWIDSDFPAKPPEISSLTGNNGTLTMAVCSTACVPFVTLGDNGFYGYDIDFAYRFCKEYGYRLNIVDYDASGLFGCLSAGKCDFGATCIAVTEERKESMSFTDIYYTGGAVLVIKDESSKPLTGEPNGFFQNIAESFQKTFIREQRYKLFLSGIETTLLIVLFSILFGTALGYLLFFGCYKRGKVFRFFVLVLNKITENTPIVVILMILYYVVFGSMKLSGIWVSVIGFTLIFSGNVCSLIRVGVNAVDPAQREAALALGYNENKTLFVIILPQAARHFLPGYKSAIVQLIKGTAIVGYIAVQDLTKVSDIIRSRTYEAFFPLIATAILYFGMAMLFTAVINRIEIKIDPHSRKINKILRGIKTK